MLGKMEPVGLIPYSFKGTSMLPTFQEGDQLVATPYAGIEDIQPGDVIIYRPAYLLDEDRNICHRVESVNTETGEIITKGDNNQEVDSPIKFQDVQGHVINATRPARIERFVVYNQYDKECREFIEALRQGEEEEKASLTEQAEEAAGALEASEEFQTYKESQVYQDYFESLALLEAEEQVTPLDSDELIDELIVLKNQVEASEEYQAFKSKKEELQIRELQDQIDAWKPAMIKTDNPEIRERFPLLEAFPVVVLNIPEYFDGELKEFAPAKQEYLNRAVSLDAAVAWEDEKRASIRTIMEAKTLSLQKKIAP